jgi:hypothetical protein
MALCRAFAQSADALCKLSQLTLENNEHELLCRWLLPDE